MKSQRFFSLYVAFIHSGFIVAGGARSKADRSADVVRHSRSSGARLLGRERLSALDGLQHSEQFSDDYASEEDDLGDPVAELRRREEELRAKERELRERTDSGDLHGRELERLKEQERKLKEREEELRRREKELREKGRIIDYNKETKIYWSEKSALPVTVEGLIALTWVSMVAGFPLLAFSTDGYARSQMILAVVMWVVLVIGLYLFHSVLVFQSSHFEVVRSLTLVECVYFMSQVLTTVGYGDITPATPRGQVFVGIYVIFSLCVIMNFVSKSIAVVGTLMEKLEDHVGGAIADEKVPLPHAVRKRVSPRREKQPHCKEWVPRGPPPLPWRDFSRAVWAYTIVCLVGILFFTSWPGENKTLLQGIYMSVITLSTVGFGAVTPITEPGKVFGAFWMLIGSAALVRLVGTFSALMNSMKLGERWQPDHALQHDTEMLQLLPEEEITKVMFMKFALQHGELLEKEDLERIEAVFHKLQPEADGTISKQAVLDFFCQPAPS